MAQPEPSSEHTISQAKCGVCLPKDDNRDAAASPTEGKKICIIGCGNWGATVTKIVGENALRHQHLHNTVTVQVNEEVIDGRKLTEIINQDHENKKYLPGHKLPTNIVAIADPVEATQNADALIFVLPCQFFKSFCETIAGKIKPTACALSMTKGFEEDENGELLLLSSVIEQILHINVSVLMGANIATEIASGFFSEATLGYDDENLCQMWMEIMQSDSFRITPTEDKISVEIYSGFKNVIAVGAGMIDGLQYGENTKATLIRQGVAEMIKFMDIFYPGLHLTTFFESCGVADIITTCFGGRNREIGEVFVESGKDMETLEKEKLGGQKIQGAITAKIISHMLKKKDKESEFPVLIAVHQICSGERRPKELLDAMKLHTGEKFALHATVL